MQRRRFLALGGATLLAVSAAGCSESEATTENRNETWAEATAAGIDDQTGMSIRNWAINDDRLHLHVDLAISAKRGFQLIAGAYAGNVDNGLDLPMTATGYDGASETILYFEMEPEPAQQFMDDELTEDEYLNTAEIHIP